MTQPVDFSLRLAQALLGTRADAILAADPDGIIRFWNPGAIRIFGFAEDQAIGRSLDIIIPEKLRARHWEGWKRVVQTSRSRYAADQMLSVPAMTSDGRRISVEFTLLILHDQDGGIVGIGAILRDVTARFNELRDLRTKVAGASAG
ncbi:PAS domain-containing protein [Acidomonas methanolica]|uniref:PAS domain-containing protein n=1 Tax=Acidomonas methanolica TaxID=437 RepID=UPI00211A667A|nr:PAS domain S-box protein [Acidomonas methanolica]MCQ9156630.1 PAS domain-containing protein [Acidomonas methanolica]